MDIEDDLKTISFNEITPGIRYEEEQMRKTMYKETMKVQTSVKKSLSLIFKSKRYMSNLAICTWLWMSGFLMY